MCVVGFREALKLGGCGADMQAPLYWVSSKGRPIVFSTAVVVNIELLASSILEAAPMAIVE